MVTGSFPPRCIKGTQWVLAAFSRTGVFETRFHLVFGKITSVCKSQKFASATGKSFAEVWNFTLQKNSF